MTQTTLEDGTIEIDIQGGNVVVKNSSPSTGSISVSIGDDGSYPQVTLNSNRSFTIGSIESACLESDGTTGSLSLKTNSSAYKTSIKGEDMTGNKVLIAPAEDGRLITSNVKQSAGEPTTDDIADGTFKIWYNTTTGYAKVWLNIGGNLAQLPFNFNVTGDNPAVVGGRPNDR